MVVSAGSVAAQGARDLANGHLAQRRGDVVGHEQREVLVEVFSRGAGGARAEEP